MDYKDFYYNVEEKMREGEDGVSVNSIVAEVCESLPITELVSLFESRDGTDVYAKEALIDALAKSTLRRMLNAYCVAVDVQFSSGDKKSCKRWGFAHNGKDLEETKRKAYEMMKWGITHRADKGDVEVYVNIVISHLDDYLDSDELYGYVKDGKLVWEV